ncbi:hypothetical protein R6Q57_028179 [Mikania cordata]
MDSFVSQGLQSCLEHRLAESILQTPKSSSKPTQLHQKPKPSNNGESVTNNNGWGFFNVFENPTSNHVEDDEVYVHPMVKRSASALSTMSLEMCTESLGTETGSDVSESSDEFNWEEKERFAGLLRSKSRRKPVNRRAAGGGFPPPLTSISSSDVTVKVRPHRVGGRLVIKAVSVSFSDCGTKFEAQRTNGRLSLSLLRDCCVNVETRRAKMKNEGGEEGCCDGDMEEGECGWSEIVGDKREICGETKIESPKQKYESSKSVENLTEFELIRCKHVENGNKRIENWSLFPVVIS